MKCRRRQKGTTADLCTSFDGPEKQVWLIKSENPKV
jgi:hypothetical protein